VRRDTSTSTGRTHDDDPRGDGQTHRFLLVRDKDDVCLPAVCVRQREECLGEQEDVLLAVAARVDVPRRERRRWHAGHAVGWADGHGRRNRSSTVRWKMHYGD
jgi:hypothetical protein